MTVVIKETLNYREKENLKIPSEMISDPFDSRSISASRISRNSHRKVVSFVPFEDLHKNSSKIDDLLQKFDNSRKKRTIFWSSNIYNDVQSVGLYCSNPFAYSMLHVDFTVEKGSNLHTIITDDAYKKRSYDEYCSLDVGDYVVMSPSQNTTFYFEFSLGGERGYVEYMLSKIVGNVRDCIRTYLNVRGRHSDTILLEEICDFDFQKNDCGLQGYLSSFRTEKAESSNWFKAFYSPTRHFKIHLPFISLEEKEEKASLFLEIARSVQYFCSPDRDDSETALKKFYKEGLQKESMLQETLSQNIIQRDTETDREKALKKFCEDDLVFSCRLTYPFTSDSDNQIHFCQVREKCIYHVYTTKEDGVLREVSGDEKDTISSIWGRLIYELKKTKSIWVEEVENLERNLPNMLKFMASPMMSSSPPNNFSPYLINQLKEWSNTEQLYYNKSKMRQIYSLRAQFASIGDHEELDMEMASYKTFYAFDTIGSTKDLIYMIPATVYQDEMSVIDIWQTCFKLIGNSGDDIMKQCLLKAGWSYKHVKSLHRRSFTEGEFEDDWRNIRTLEWYASKGRKFEQRCIAYAFVRLMYLRKSSTSSSEFLGDISQFRLRHILECESSDNGISFYHYRPSQASKGPGSSRPPRTWQRENSMEELLSSTILKDFMTKLVIIACAEKGVSFLKNTLISDSNGNSYREELAPLSMDLTSYSFQEGGSSKSVVEAIISAARICNFLCCKPEMINMNNLCLHVMDEKGELADRVASMYMSSLDPPKPNAYKCMISQFHADSPMSDKLDKNNRLVQMRGKTIVVDENVISIRPTKPQDYLSNMGGCSVMDEDEMESKDYKAAEELEEWLTDLFPDEEERMYFLAIVAIGLAGRNICKIAVFFVGDTNGGKSMVKMLIELTMKDYAVTINNNSMTEDLKRGQADSEAASQVGKRYVFTQEMNQNEKINSSTMKTDTGSDIKTFRQLYKTAESYRPSHIPISFSNYCPVFTTIDETVIGRVAIVYFGSVWKREAPATKEEQRKQRVYPRNDDFASKIPSYTEHFLKMLLKIYPDSRNVIRNPPESFRARAQQHWHNVSPMDRYVEEMIEYNQNCKIPSRAFTTSYTRWLKECGINETAKQDFNQSVVNWMRNRMRGTDNIEKKVYTKGGYVHGLNIRIREETCP